MISKPHLSVKCLLWPHLEPLLESVDVRVPVGDLLLEVGLALPEAGGHVGCGRRHHRRRRRDAQPPLQRHRRQLLRLLPRGRLARRGRHCTDLK